MAAADPTASAFIRRIGDYDVDILNELGQGAWGTVYKGKHKDRKTAVAAKKMRLDPKVPEARDLVRNESELLLKVKNHPYLLKIHHAQFIDQPYLKFHEFWIITSFCREGNLSEYCMTHILSKKQKLQISRQTAAGLVFLHNLQPCIIHRDIKPENILLDIVDGVLTAKLADFGLARNMEQTFMSTMAGTQSYVAPEMWPWSKGRRLQYDEKIDTFALGLVHGLVLRQKTKKPLHDLGEAMPLGQQMVNAVETNKAVPVAIVIEKTDDEMTVKWKGLILQMTAYEPSQRPSMEHVEEELTAMQEDLAEEVESEAPGSTGNTNSGSRGLDPDASQSGASRPTPVIQSSGTAPATSGTRSRPARTDKAPAQRDLDQDVSQSDAFSLKRVIKSLIRPSSASGSRSRRTRSDKPPAQRGRASANTMQSNNDIVLPVQLKKLSSAQLKSRHNDYSIGVDGNYVLEVDEKDGQLKKWDLSNDQVVFSVPLPDGVSADCRKFFGPKGEVVLWQEDEKESVKKQITYILDSEGRLLRQFPVEDEPIAVIGSGVVYVDEKYNLVVRSLADHSQVLTLKCGGSYRSICEEPTTGKLAVTAGYDTLLIFSPSGGRLVEKKLTYRPGWHQAVTCVSERLFAVVEYPCTVRLHDWSSGDELQADTRQQLWLGVNVIWQIWMGLDRVFYIMSGGYEVWRYQL